MSAESAVPNLDGSDGGSGYPAHDEGIRRTDARVLEFRADRLEERGAVERRIGSDGCGRRKRVVRPGGGDGVETRPRQRANPVHGTPRSIAFQSWYSAIAR